MVLVQDIITGDKMGHYKHLSTIEREIILCGITKGLSISKISKELGRNKSTISRELKRNTCTESYSPSKAQNSIQTEDGSAVLEKNFPTRLYTIL